MSIELVYTSAPRGLNPDSTGFCTVATTPGMNPQVMAKLEGLSGYELKFNLSDPKAKMNPVNFAHTRIQLGAGTESVLSRVAFSGADYSGRTNKIAHHFLLDAGEQMGPGPAWMLAQMDGSILRTNWSGDPQKNLPPRRLDTVLLRGSVPTGPAHQWQTVADDAGWAGVLAKAFRDNPNVPAYVVFNVGTNLLPLFQESLAVLPPAERWNVGFATYYSTLPAGCQYHWRGILVGSSAEKEMKRFPKATVIDLTVPLPPAETNEFTDAARTGRTVDPVRTASTAKAEVGGAAGTASVFGEADDTTVRITAPGTQGGSRERAPAGVRIGCAHAPRKSPVATVVLSIAVALLAGATALTLWKVTDLQNQLSNAQRDNASLTDKLAEANTPAQDLAAKERAATELAEKAEQEPLKPSTSPGTPDKQPDSAVVQERVNTAQVAASQVVALAKKVEEAANAAEAAAKQAKETKDPKAIGEFATTAKQEYKTAGTELTNLRTIVDKVENAVTDVEREVGTNGADPLLKSHLDKAHEARNTAKKAYEEAEVLVARAKTAADGVGSAVSVKPPETTPTAPVSAFKVEPPLDRVKIPELKGSRFVRAPTVSADGMLVYDVGKANAFVKPPESLPKGLEKLKHKFKENNLAFVTKDATLGREQPAITCELKSGASGRILECRIEGKEADKLGDDLAWLVIEVADTPSGALYLCTMRGRPKQVTQPYRLGYFVEEYLVEVDRDGKKKQEKRHKPSQIRDQAPLSFTYPWADKLYYRYVDWVGEQKPPIFNTTASTACKITWQANVGKVGDEKSISVILSLDATLVPGKEVTVTPRLETLTKIDEYRAKAWESGWGGLRSHRDESEATLKRARQFVDDFPNKIQEEKDPRKREELEYRRSDAIDKIENQPKVTADCDTKMAHLAQPVANFMEAADKAVNAKEHSKILVNDIWGVPVAALSLKFEKCDVGEYIWTHPLPGDVKPDIPWQTDPDPAKRKAKGNKK